MRSPTQNKPAKPARSVALLGLLGLVLSGCGFHSDTAALGRLRTRIHDEIGSDASVNVHSAYGSTTVTIRLEHLPTGDPKTVQARVEALTKAEFPKTDYVVVLARL
ncbi:MAG TPA: hypothetical protein VGF76_22040 [Polyangiaceae bacterium]